MLGKKTKVYFRADGSSTMGLGHIIRSLSLAEMLKKEFECHFIIRTPLETLKNQILKICDSIIELPACENDEKEADFLAVKYFNSEDIVVLDGYHFKTFYQTIIKNIGCKIVCIDDIFACHYVADAIINHAGGVTSDNYSAEPSTKFYLGLSYALLRAPFLNAAKNREIRTNHKGVLICLGGADPNNDTLEVLKKCIEKGSHLEYYVVIGGAYQYRKQLTRFIEQNSVKINLLSNLDADQMVNYMKQCSIAVTSPSTISYEYLSIGGELYLYVIADNQININAYFLTEKLAFPFDSFLEISPEENISVQNKQASLLKGDTDIALRSIFKKL